MMDPMTQAALFVAMANGRRAREAAGTIEGALDELDKRTMDGVLNRLDREEQVSPTEALSAWQQLLANRRLRRHLERREREGAAAAVAVTPIMNGEE